VITAVETLDALGFRSEESLYWGLRLAMVRRIEDLPAFDEAFANYWDAASAGPEAAAAATTRPGPGGESLDRPAARNAGADQEAAATRPGPMPAEEADDGSIERGAYSDVEVLRFKDFADYSPEDYLRLEELLAELRFTGPWRRSRRNKAAHRGSLDINRTVRAGFRTQGHPVRRRYRQRQLKRRQLTFVCDVSGSMGSYSRAVLQLAHAAVLAQRRVEAFAFATRLTRITPELVRHDPEGALRAAVESVVDWSGGTRMGACFAELNRRYRAACQGAVIVIASDGWDLGDPEELARESALLSRIAYRIVWVNPHLQDPEFEALTRGMSTVLPNVDDFVTCHNFDSFTALTERFSRL
jgi:uncharacterized protein with von Willebrand factor type A (vWA) domain